MKRVRIVERRKDAVIIAYGIQTLCIHDFDNRHKQYFDRFLADLGDLKTTNLGKILTIATKHNMKITYSTRKKR